MKNTKPVLVGFAVLLGIGILLLAYTNPSSIGEVSGRIGIDKTGDRAAGTRDLLENSPSVNRAGSKSNLARDFTPKEAYDLAKKSVACTYSTVSAENEPKGLTSDQKKQLEGSRLSKSDCSFDSKYSVYELAKFAAESGDTQAMLDFSGLAAAEFTKEESALDAVKIKEFKQDSVKYLLAAAGQGSTDALSRLSENYWSGIFSDKDLIRGYAYAYAYNSISQDDMSLFRLRQMEQGVSGADLARARQIGQEIINSRGVK